ncbi:hypothetical protein AB3N58_13990 [Leptospira sp. WS60.C2]
MKQTLFQTLVLLGLTFLFTACQMEPQVPESEANENLLVGLLAGSGLSTSFLLEYNGQWNAGYAYDANGKVTQASLTGRLIIATNPDGSGSIISGFEKNSDYFGGGDTTYRILSFDKSTRRLYYQNTPGGNNFNHSTFGRIDYTPVTTSGCEFGATKCFYFCETLSNKATYSEVLASTVTSDPAKYTTNGCGEIFKSTYSRALLRTENSTWTGL